MNYSLRAPGEATLVKPVDCCRAAVWGSGRLSAEVVRTLAGLTSVDLVSVLAHSEGKAGRDADEPAGIWALGIPATTDGAEMLAARPEVAGGASFYLGAEQRPSDAVAAEYAVVEIEGRPSLRVTPELKASLRDRLERYPENPDTPVIYSAAAGPIVQSIPLVMAAPAGVHEDPSVPGAFRRTFPSAGAQLACPGEDVGDRHHPFPPQPLCTSRCRDVRTVGAT
ncbi:hypothetical protein ACFT9I_01530 [Streptomyces sp. NPDC057137]|uniref:hypothetical protein n=1 Tax=Streptomyces sp. NPDC057137 TaxID=3346030 RepID=UPI00362C9A5F